jgi:hypothetical protein
MPHRKNVIQLTRTTDGLERTQAHLEQYRKDRAEGRPYLRVDYRHLHLKHKIDISTINFGGHANANQRTHPLAAIWRALKAVLKA